MEVHAAPATDGAGSGAPRVSVTNSSNEWEATAGSAAASHISQIRFRQSGQIVIPGSMPVAGTMTGTAVHLPELFLWPGVGHPGDRHRTGIGDGNGVCGWHVRRGDEAY